MAAVSPGVVDLYRVGSREKRWRGWGRVDPHLLDRVLEGHHRYYVPVVVVVPYVVQSPVLGVIIGAPLEHQVTVLGWYREDGLCPEALAHAVVYVPPSGLGVGKFGCYTVVTDPVGGVVVFLLVFGASKCHPHGDCGYARCVIEVHPECAVDVCRLEPLVACASTAEHRVLVRYPNMVPVIESLAGVVALVGVQCRVEAHVGAVVVGVGHPVSVGVRAGAPVGRVGVVRIGRTVAIGVVVLVVTCTVVVSVQPL